MDPDLVASSEASLTESTVFSKKDKSGFCGTNVNTFFRGFIHFIPKTDNCRLIVITDGLVADK